MNTSPQPLQAMGGLPTPRQVTRAQLRDTGTLARDIDSMYSVTPQHQEQYASKGFVRYATACVQSCMRACPFVSPFHVNPQLGVKIIDRALGRLKGVFSHEPLTALKEKVAQVVTEADQTPLEDDDAYARAFVQASLLTAGTPVASSMSPFPTLAVL